MAIMTDIIKKKGLALFAATWRLRRRAIYITATFTVAMIALEVYKTVSPQVHEITMRMIGLTETLLVGWILGSVVEDGFNNSIWSECSGPSGKVQTKGADTIIGEE